LPQKIIDWDDAKRFAKKKRKIIALDEKQVPWGGVGDEGPIIDK